jgi:hypothetical protein
MRRSGRPDRLGAGDETIEPCGQPRWIGLQPPRGRNHDLPPVKLEHGPVVVIEQPARHMNLTLRRDADQILVEGTVVDRAQAQPVADERLALLVDVTDDVRGIEQSGLSEGADGAAVAVGRVPMKYANGTPS